MPEIFSSLDILEDKTNGAIQLEVRTRGEGEKRRYKIVNNLTGLFSLANPEKMQEVGKALNNLLPSVDQDEVILGFLDGSVIPAYVLAEQRKIKFNLANQKQVGDFTKAIQFSQPNKEEPSYIYGLKKGDSVIMIDDEASTGESLINAYLTLHKSGVIVKAICVIIEAINFDSRNKIKNQTGIDLISLIKIKLK